MLEGKPMIKREAMRQLTSKLPSLALIAMSAAGLLGFQCSGKDSTKCNEAIEVTRKSITAKDFNLARQWRERAYTYCSDGAQLSSLDGEISSAEKAELDAKAQAEAVKKQADAVTSLVRDLAFQGKDDGAQIARSATCPDPKEKKEGWCDARRTIAGNPNTINVRYWNKEPKAMLISAKPQGPASCDGLSASTVVRTFGSTIDGVPAEFKHCTLSGNLSGLQALVGSSEKLSHVQVFTTEYLAKDPKLAQRLKGGN